MDSSRRPERMSCDQCVAKAGERCGQAAKTCCSCLALHVAQTSLEPIPELPLCLRVKGQRARSERLGDQRLARRASFAGQAAETVLMWGGFHALCLAQTSLQTLLRFAFVFLCRRAEGRGGRLSAARRVEASERRGAGGGDGADVGRVLGAAAGQDAVPALQRRLPGLVCGADRAVAGRQRVFRVAGAQREHGALPFLGSACNSAARDGCPRIFGSFLGFSRNCKSGKSDEVLHLCAGKS